MMSEEGDPGQCSRSSHFFSAFALLVFFMFLIASQTLPAYGSILQVNVRLEACDEINEKQLTVWLVLCGVSTWC